MGKRALFKDPLFKEMSNIMAALATVPPKYGTETQELIHFQELSDFRELAARAYKVVEIIKKKTLTMDL